MNNTLMPLDPDPHEWLHEKRINFIKNSFNSCAYLLEDINLLDQVLNAWILKELIVEASNYSQHSLSAGNVSLESFSTSLINNNLCDDKQLSCLLQWAHQRWGHRLESLYLSKQAKLDLVSCKMITVKSNNLNKNQTE